MSSLPSTNRSWLALPILAGLVTLAVLSAAFLPAGSPDATTGYSGNVTVELTAEEIVERAQSGDGFRTLRGTQQRTVTRNGETRTVATSKIWERSPNQSRIEMRSTNDLPTRVIVRSGATQRSYRPEQQERISIRPVDNRRVLFGSRVIDEITDEPTTVAVRGTDTVLGRPAYVLTFTPTAEDQYWRLAVWIDRERFYPLKLTTERTDDDYRVTTVFEDVAFDTPIDEERFRLDPRPDERLIGLRTGQFDSFFTADLSTPVNLTEPAVPDGYDHAWTRVTSDDGAATSDDTMTVVAKYRDAEGSRLSVRWSANRSIPDGEAVPIEGDRGTVVAGEYWTAVYRDCDGLTLVIGGATLDRDALVDVAASVDCPERGLRGV